MTKTAWLFPGQGSQAVGMGRALYESFAEAKEVFQEVDEALKQKLSALMFEGPDSYLLLTENAQPAIMACSVAALRVMQKQLGVEADAADYVAGHSLGEYSAHVAAGTMSLTQAAQLLKIRGQSMQQAVAPGVGMMAALIGLGADAVQALCHEISASGDVCEIANDNSDQQVVISGAKQAVEKTMELAKAAGAKRAVALAVSAPFHCSLMQSAAEKMQAALAEASMKDAALPIICNVTAAPETLAQALKAHLVTQVTGRVRWRESADVMVRSGVTHFVELGQGMVLTGLMKRAAPEATLLHIGEPADLDSYQKAA